MEQWQQVGEVVRQATGRTLVGTSGGLYEFGARELRVPMGSVEGAVHDLCHFVVATEEERRMPNMGLSQDWSHPRWDRMVTAEELSWSLEFFLYGDPSVNVMRAKMTPEARSSGGGASITLAERLGSQTFSRDMRGWAVQALIGGRWVWYELEYDLGTQEAAEARLERWQKWESREGRTPPKLRVWAHPSPMEFRLDEAEAARLALETERVDGAIATAIHQVLVLPLTEAAIAEMTRAQQLLAEGGEVRYDGELRTRALKMAEAIGLPLDKLRETLRKRGSD